MQPNSRSSFSNNASVSSKPNYQKNPSSVTNSTSRSMRSSTSWSGWRNRFSVGNPRHPKAMVTQTIKASRRLQTMTRKTMAITQATPASAKNGASKKAPKATGANYESIYPLKNSSTIWPMTISVVRSVVCHSNHCPFPKTANRFTGMSKSFGASIAGAVICQPANVTQFPVS